MVYCMHTNPGSTGNTAPDEKRCCRMRMHVWLGLFVLFALVPALALPAQAAEDEEHWSTRIASPSYGFNMAFLTIEYGEDEDTETVAMPGLDIRHFNGINVTESGRFYFGYEVGAAVNFYLGSGRTYETGGAKYTLDNALAATGFLMGKHGYRRSIGSTAKGLGLGLGFELGLGLMGGVGLASFTDKDDESYSYEEPVVSPAFEVAGEFAVRTEKDLRFVARVAALTGGPLVDFDGEDIGITDLSGETFPIRPNLRFGFVRDY